MHNDKYISFKELYTMNVEITDICAERQKWVTGVLYSRGIPRPNSAIIYLSGCNGIYTDLNNKNTSFFAPQNSIVCLPQGSDYSVFNNECNLAQQDAYIVEFNIKSNGRILSFGSAPFLIDTLFNSLISATIEDVVKTYEEPIKSPIGILSGVCNLLAILGKEENQVHSKDYSAIAQGMELIEKDPFSDISLDEIASMCNVSPSCFRRNFKKYYGKSPIQHRTDLKIKTIKFMLENSDVTIENMTELLGMDNVPYLYKMFKKNVGISPGDYRDKMKKRI